MGHRSLGVPAVVIAVASLAVLQAAGQSSPKPSAKAAKTWPLPRTADGQPDLTGYWTHATYTPVERPAEFAGKEFWTPEEAAAYEKQRVAQFLGQAAEDRKSVV